MKVEESLSELKQDILQLVESSQDEAILNEVRQLLQHPAEDWWDELTEAQKASVERAEADVAEGRVFTHEQVKADLKKWLKE
jgi:predicted transcriptional regulator